jgi:hypothetical protein
MAPAPASHGGSPPFASQDQPFPSVDPVPLVTPEPAAYPLPAAVAAMTGGPATRQPENRRRAAITGTIATALILIAAGSLGVAVARYVTDWAAGIGSVTPALTPAEVRTDQMAATWVSDQVSHSAVVSCDQAMCTALTADGFPSRGVRVLGSTSSPPVTSAVVIVTQAVRELFGSSLTSLYAPAILATFGSADANVTVQVIDAQGALAYQKELAADLKKRESVGLDLAGAGELTMAAGVKGQLLAGAPDSRLLVALTTLVSMKPIDILDFGNVPPVTDNTIPLRYADLAESDQAAHVTGSAYVRALRADLDSMPPSYRPTTVIPETVNGQAALRIEFSAPSPLGLFGS